VDFGVAAGVLTARTACRARVAFAMRKIDIQKIDSAINGSFTAGSNAL